MYQIRINWNQAVKQENGNKDQGSPSPSLDVRALLQENVFAPVNLPINGDDTTNGDMGIVFTYQLTRLIFVPLAPEQGTRESTERTIIAVFAVIPSPSAALLDTTHQYQQTSSIVCRWELQKDVADKLSPCFDLLSVKKKATVGIQPRVSTFSMPIIRKLILGSNV